MLNIDRAQRELATLFGAQCAISAGGGGVTGETGRLAVDGRRYFFKWLPDGDALDAERDGLELLAAGIRVPAVVHRGPLADGEVLVLEWLDLHPLRDGAALGRALKALHGLHADRFGFRRDNWIGGSRQYNGPMDDWAAFFVERRLRPQLAWARKRGLPAGLAGEVEAVMARASEWLASVTVSPSLVHGDLWGGNVAALADGSPVLFDPAVYYGHGEVDLAMLSLFGAAPEGTYEAYGLHPTDSDVRRRKRLYNLYHLLNHFVLFGGGYRSAIAGQTAALLSA